MQSMKVRYAIAASQPVCSACGYPSSLTTAPCVNCGEPGGLLYPLVVVECDYHHAHKVPPEHIFPNIVSVEDPSPRTQETEGESLALVPYDPVGSTA
jgi:hypothetical protein